MAKTAVVILNFNGLKFLKMFLGEVVARTPSQETVIYVADNGSTDGSAEWVSGTFKDVRLIRLTENRGFSEGYNLALARIDAEYYVLLNSDMEVTPGWLSPLITHLDDNPDAASCQPKILSYHKRDHFEYAGAAGGFIDKYGYPFCRGRILNHTEKDTGQYDRPADIFWSSGACMAVRAEAWKKCGGFDPAFFAHMEEIDLCWRFHKSGYRVSYIPLSSVYHVGGGTLSYQSPFKTFLNFRNNLFLLYKNLPAGKLRRIMMTRKILDGVAAMFFLLKGEFRSTGAVWKAHMEFYRHKADLKEKRKSVSDLTIIENPAMILNKSVVFEFYVKRTKTFTRLTAKSAIQ
ncbi:MAG: glycosyltransferase family 2 protein [Bacteroidota bacterium]